LEGADFQNVDQGENIPFLVIGPSGFYYSRMKSLLKILITVILFVPVVSLADYKPRDLFAGKDLRLIKAAMPLILKQGYKADEIKIDISEDESKYTVSAVDRKAENSPEQRGSLPGFLIYSVDLDKKELKALRSYYNR
jgi:hypothetical protein